MTAPAILLASLIVTGLPFGRAQIMPNNDPCIMGAGKLSQCFGMAASADGKIDPALMAAVCADANCMGVHANLTDPMSGCKEVAGETTDMFSKMCNGCMLAFMGIPQDSDSCSSKQMCDPTDWCNQSWANVFESCTEDDKIITERHVDENGNEMEIAISPVIYKERFDTMCTPCGMAFLDLTDNQWCTPQGQDPDPDRICDAYCGMFYFKIGQTCVDGAPAFMINPNDDKPDDQERQEFMQKIDGVKAAMAQGCPHIDENFEAAPYYRPEPYPATTPEPMPQPEQPKCGKIAADKKAQLAQAGWKPMRCSTTMVEETVIMGSTTMPWMGGGNHCRCCEYITYQGDPECSDNSGFMTRLNNRAFNVYSYEMTDAGYEGQMLCGTCGFTDSDMECSAMIPKSGGQEVNYDVTGMDHATCSSAPSPTPPNMAGDAQCFNEWWNGQVCDGKPDGEMVVYDWSQGECLSFEDIYGGSDDRFTTRTSVCRDSGCTNCSYTEDHNGEREGHWDMHQCNACTFTADCYYMEIPCDWSGMMPKPEPEPETGKTTDMPMMGCDEVYCGRDCFTYMDCGTNFTDHCRSMPTDCPSRCGGCSRR